MATAAEIENFIRRTTPPWNGARRAYDWYGMCAGLTYRTIREMGGTVADGAYGSAWLAYLAAKAAGRIESTDWRKAPAGAVHYWDYIGVASNGLRDRWGHVTLDILGGGTDTLSATGYAHEVWNKSAGLISVPAQSARGMTYMGWARTYGRSNRLTITTGSTAGEEENDMSAESERQIEAIYKAVFGPNNGPNKAQELNYTDVGGNKRTAKYGVLDIVTENQSRIGKIAAIDYEKLAQEIVKAGGTAPTAAQIAKAVNDDAAKRLTS